MMTISVLMSFFSLCHSIIFSLVLTATCLLAMICDMPAPFLPFYRIQLPYWSNSDQSGSFFWYHCRTASGGWLVAKR